MKIKAAAKINLTLDIVGQRGDGYHLLDSVMQPISLYDYIQIEKSDKLNVRFSDPTIDGNTSLVYKTAKFFFEYKMIDGGADIYVENNIPTSSGMGGGSCDAAATLLGLNELYNANIDVDELCEIGLDLGADIPFCIVGHTARVEGIGGKVTPITKIGNYPIVIIKDKEKLSTGHMYSMLDKRRKHKSYTKHMIKEIKKGNLKGICKYITNAFLSVCNIDNERKLLLDLGAKGVGLSGSGPSVFGIFDNIDTCKNCFNTLKDNGHNVYIASLCDKSVEIIEQ